MKRYLFDKFNIEKSEFNTVVYLLIIGILLSVSLTVFLVHFLDRYIVNVEISHLPLTIVLAGGLSLILSSVFALLQRGYV